MAQLLSRHTAGDWGDVDKEDAKANDRALEDGTRLLSAAILGVSEASIMNYLCHWNIRRPRKPSITADQIWQLYWAENLTMREAAELLGTSRQNLSRKMWQFDIPARKQREKKEGSPIHFNGQKNNNKTKGERS